MYRMTKPGEKETAGSSRRGYWISFKGRRMKKIVYVGLMLLLPLKLLALPKPILADKYLMGAKSAIEKKEYKRADEYFGKIVKLDIALPDEFYFQYAKNAFQLKAYGKSLKYADLYLEKAGNTGKYYRDALLISVKSEEALKEAVDPTYTLTINPRPSNATVQILNIKEKYKDGIRLKKGIYTIKVSKKGYYSKRMKIDLDKNTSKLITLTRQKQKKPLYVWHCNAISVRASGWAESPNYRYARRSALRECEMRRQTDQPCEIRSCYRK